MPESVKPTILVIEDDDTIGDAMGRALVLAGYDVAKATRGEEGLTKAFEIEPSLIILDYNLPDTDGLQVLDKLRANMWGHSAKVIFASNVYDVAVVNETMRLGVTDYIMKADLSIEQFVKVVGKYVQPLNAEGEVATADDTQES